MPGPAGTLLSVIAAGATTRRTSGAVLSGRRRRQAPERGRKSTATVHPAAPKAKLAGPSAEQMDLDDGWNHVPGGRVVKVTTTSPYPNPTPQPVTKVPKQLQVTATRKTARPKKPELNQQQPLSRLL